jgi:hypothetical protein
MRSTRQPHLDASCLCTKNGAAHRVLSKEAIALLMRVPKLEIRFLAHGPEALLASARRSDLDQVCGVSDWRLATCDEPVSAWRDQESLHVADKVLNQKRG